MGRVEDITKVIDAALDAISKDPNGLCLTCVRRIIPMHELKTDEVPITYYIRLGKPNTRYHYSLTVPRHAVVSPIFTIVIEDTDYPGGLRWQHTWHTSDPWGDVEDYELEYMTGALSYHIEQAIVELITITLTNKEPNK